MKEDTVNATQAQLDTHEAVCAERYKGIMHRIDRMERVVILAASAIICAAMALVWTTTIHRL